MPLDRMDDRTDDDLLAAYAAGAQEAARALTLRLTPRVFAHAVRMLGDRAEAEDVTQEALLRLWKAAPGWQPGGAQVRTWLYTVTANLCMDRLRRRVRRGDVALEAVGEPADPGPGVDRAIQARAREDALARALQALPERQRQAVVLRLLEGLSNPDIARIMDITPRAVESLTARGKRALAAALRHRRAELGWTDDEQD